MKKLIFFTDTPTHRHTYTPNSKLIQQCQKKYTLILFTFLSFHLFGQGGQTLGQQFCNEEISLVINALPGLTYNASSNFPGGLIGENIILNTDFYINTPTYQIASCHIHVAPGRRIIINSNSNCTIFGSSLFACQRRWQGIQVLQNGGQLNMAETNIEDAEIAIEAFAYSNVRIAGNNFNRNVIGVANHSTSLQNGETFNLIATGNTFQCSSQLLPPANVNFTSSAGWSRAGMRFVRCSETVGILNATANIFRALNFGIEIYSSDIYINNCIFSGQRRQGINLTPNGNTNNFPQHAGCGIFGQANGNGQIWVNYLDLGGALDFINNEADGIRVRNGMGLDCKNAQFQNNLGWGIQVANNPFNSSINIANNSFVINTLAGRGGVLLERSAGTGGSTNNKIEWNNFTINKPDAGANTPDFAHAIWINGVRNGRDYCFIRNNIITLTANTASCGIFYSPVASTDYNLIDNNTITGPANHNEWGIAFLGGPGAGMHNMVYNNTISTPQGPTFWDNYPILCAMHTSNTPNTHFCHNNTFGNTHGLHLFTQLTNIDVAINTFGPNFRGVQMETDPTNLLGINQCKGNIFDQTITNFETAAHGGVGNLNIQNSTFRINPNVVAEHPPSQIPQGFFMDFFPCTFTPPLAVCPIFLPTNPLVPSLTEADRIIAKDIINPQYSSDRWELRYQLYRRLRDYPQIYSSDPDFNSFMQSMLSSATAQLCMIDDNTSQAYLGAMNTMQQLLSLRNQIKVVTDSMLIIDELMAGTGTFPPGMVAIKNLLTTQYESLIVSFEAIYTQYLTTRNQSLNSLKTQLDNITTSGLHESYARDVRKATINLALNGVLSSQEIDLLTLIASACPDDVGHTVNYAQALLPEGITYTQNINDAHCVQGRSESHQKAVISDLEIQFYPNPSIGDINILSKIPLKEIQILDLNGKLILSKEIDSMKNVSIDLLGKGVYLLQTKDINGDIHSQKLIIQ